jgi:hypothetical protein
MLLPSVLSEPSIATTTVLVDVTTSQQHTTAASLRVEVARSYDAVDQRLSDPQRARRLLHRQHLIRARYFDWVLHHSTGVRGTPLTGVRGGRTTTTGGLRNASRFGTFVLSSVTSPYLRPIRVASSAVMLIHTAPPR